MRVHCQCLTGDVFGSARCDCGEQLELRVEKIAEEGRGVFLYLLQEGRGIGLLNKLQGLRAAGRGARHRVGQREARLPARTSATTASAPRSCATSACARCG